MVTKLTVALTNELTPKIRGILFNIYVFGSYIRHSKLQNMLCIRLYCNTCFPTTERERETEMDRQRKRDRDGQTERQTDIDEQTEPETGEDKQ